MLVMGMLIGALWFYLGDAPAFGLINSTPWWNVLLVLLAGCLMVPLFPWWDIRGWAETYPLDGASWSLMWEYFGNIIYALIVRRFSNIVLTVFVGLSALLTIDVAMNFDTFGLLGSRGDAAYTLIGGWSLTPDQLYIGLTRLLFPFFFGLLLSRLGWKRPVRGGFWWCSLIVAATLAVPYVGSSESGWANGLYNIVAVMLIFPIVIVMGAGSDTTDARTTAWCKWLGAISYPLYISHQPLIFIHMNWIADHADAPLSTRIFVGVSIFILAVGIAWACLKLYDEPVREWLKQRFLLRLNYKIPAKNVI